MTDGEFLDKLENPKTKAEIAAAKYVAVVQPQVPCGYENADASQPAWLAFMFAWELASRTEPDCNTSPQKPDVGTATTEKGTQDG